MFHYFNCRPWFWTFGPHQYSALNSTVQCVIHQYSTDRIHPHQYSARNKDSAKNLRMGAKVYMKCASI